MPKIKITKEKLRELDACPKGVRIFSKLFPEGATATRKNVEKALDAGLDVRWLIQQMPEFKPTCKFTFSCGCAEKYKRGVLVKAWPIKSHVHCYDDVPVVEVILPR